MVGRTISDPEPVACQSIFGMSRFRGRESSVSGMARAGEYISAWLLGTTARTHQITTPSVCSPHLSSRSRVALLRQRPTLAPIHPRCVDPKMAAMRQGSGNAWFCAAVLVVAVSSFLEGAAAVQHVVGGDVAKWSFLHANSKLSFYTDWAKNVTLKTGDSLLFQYNNTTHSVLQLATEADFTACTVPKAPVDKWFTGNDAVFISKAGTYYFICGTPAHCDQGMKFTIEATGDFMAAPPRPADAPGPGKAINNAAPTAMFSGAASLLLALSVIATTLGTL